MKEIASQACWTLGAIFILMGFLTGRNAMWILGFALLACGFYARKHGTGSDAGPDADTSRTKREE